MIDKQYEDFVLVLKLDQVWFGGMIDKRYHKLVLELAKPVSSNTSVCVAGFTPPTHHLTAIMQYMNTLERRQFDGTAEQNRVSD